MNILIRVGAILVVAIGTACSSDGGTGAGVAGTYAREQTSDDVLELHDDGTFCMLQEGFEVGGTYSVEGSRLSLTLERMDLGDGSIVTPGPDPATEVGRIEGDTIIDPGGDKWIKTDDPAADCG